MSEINHNQRKHGILTVLSGFSGAGKGSILRMLLTAHDNYCVSISATSRPMRPGETEGKDYFFLDKEAFERKILDGDFLEYAQYVGNYYGTPKDFVMNQLAEGKDVILEIEIQGAMQVKENFPGALLVFVTTPDAKTLRERLVGRGTEDKERITKRLKKACDEASFMEQYEYLIVNENLEEASRTLHQIIESRHHLVSEREEFIRTLREDIRNNYQ